MIQNAWMQFLDGDNASFSEVYRRCFEKMKAYGLKIGFEERVCEDAIQDVFIKVFSSKDKLSHVKSIEFYLLNSLKNRLFDLHNEERRSRLIDYDEIFQLHENSVIEKIILSEKELQIKSDIERFLKSVTPKQRKIIHYYYQLNFSFEEIATVLDITPDAVRRSLTRAFKKIKSTHPEMVFSQMFIF